MKINDRHLLHIAIGARRAGMMEPAALLGCRIYLGNIDQIGVVARESFSLVLPALRELAKALEIMIPSVAVQCRATFRNDVNRIREFVCANAERCSEPEIRALAASVRLDKIEMLVGQNMLEDALRVISGGDQFITKDSESHHAFLCAKSWVEGVVAGQSKKAQYLMDYVQSGLNTTNPQRGGWLLLGHLEFRKMIDASYLGQQTKVREHFIAADRAYRKAGSVDSSYWLGLLYCSYGFSLFSLNVGRNEKASAEGENYYRVGRVFVSKRDISCFSTIPPSKLRTPGQNNAFDALEIAAKDKARLNHLDGYEVHHAYKVLDKELKQKRIAVFKSITQLDPLWTKLALPVRDNTEPKRFVISATTIAEVERKYRKWRDWPLSQIIIQYITFAERAFSVIRA